MVKRKNKLYLGAATLLAGVAVTAQTTEFKPCTSKVPGSEITFTMVPVPEGSFTMGSPENEKGRGADEGPQKTIAISAFWMGEKEVTHDEFLVFFNDESLARNSDVDAVTRPTTQYIDLSWGMGKQGGFPFNSMSQRTALMYCRWLYKNTGKFYRLPTEAEWEYACRAGTNTPYYFGQDSSTIGDYAWYASNSDNKYHKTGEKKPNAWGLYDMLGNVAEWTLDQYSDQYFTNAADKDPFTEPTSRYPKTLKGGGFGTNAAMMRSAARFKSESSWNRRDPQIPKSKWWLTDAAAVGFRILSPLKQPTPEEAEEFYKKYLSK
ncbi:MAG: SUMF1/EgtB/PvdO family nonheme iron enzyme [Chitinophagaceae bacterium]|nr:SUMF1/EgtB/PvdO family nonheme iron enzyme [Chitinophagaceae bacterium]